MSDIILTKRSESLSSHSGQVAFPGGKLDPGEDAVTCARRECEEELGIRVGELDCMGEHKFQFVDGYSIHCWVFRTFTYEGEAIETDEAVPLWTALDEIPYDEMWEDDRLWLPLLIQGQRFSARWVFDDDRMLDHEICLVDHVEPGGPRQD